jgi:putative transposase
MKHTRHKPVAEGFSVGVQIIRKLRQAEQMLNEGQAVSDVCRALEVSTATYHRWQQFYGAPTTSNVVRPV